MSELLNEQSPQVIAGGIFPDIAGKNAPLWRLGYNAVFDGGAAMPMPGQVVFLAGQQGNPILGINSQRIGTSKWVYWGTQNNIWRGSPSSSPASLYTLPSGNEIDSVVNAETIARKWAITSWGNWTFAALPGLGSPQPLLLAKDGVTFASVSDAPTDARAIVRVSPFVLLFNTADDPNGFAWCHRDDVEVWTATAANTAGALVIRDMDSEIIAAKPIQGGAVVAGLDSLHAVQLLGAPYWFGSRVLHDGIGAVGPDAMTVVGGGIFGVGQRGVWQASVSDFKYIDTPLLRDFFFSDVNLAQISHIVAWHDRANGLILFFYPRQGSTHNNAALVYSLRNGSWSWFLYGRSSADLGDVFGQALLGGTNGNIFAQTQVVLPVAGFDDGQMPLQETALVCSGYGLSGYGEIGYGGCTSPLGET